METANCPFCAEEVRPEAVICKHCRSDLRSAPPSPEATPVPRAPREDVDSLMNESKRNNRKGWLFILASMFLFAPAGFFFLKALGVFGFPKGNYIGTAFAFLIAAVVVAWIGGQSFSRTLSGIQCQFCGSWQVRKKREGNSNSFAFAMLFLILCFPIALIYVVIAALGVGATFKHRCDACGHDVASA